MDLSRIVETGKGGRQVLPGADSSIPLYWYRGIPATPTPTPPVASPRVRVCEESLCAVAQVGWRHQLHTHTLTTLSLTHSHPLSGICVVQLTYSCGTGCLIGSTSLVGTSGRHRVPSTQTSLTERSNTEAML
jgi:hypothetical protein